MTAKFVANRVLCGKSTLTSLLSLLTLNFAPVCLAAEQSLSLSLSGTGPVYQLALPLQVFANAQNADLSDLRLVNSLGQDIPWSWHQAEVAQNSVEQNTVPLFAVNKATKLQGMQIRIAENGHLQLLQAKPATIDQIDWLADLSHLQGQLVEAKLSLPEQTQGVFSLQVELSDDLQNWRPYSDAVAIVQLSQAGQQIQQLSFSLGGQRARYLRMRWLGQNQAGKIQDLQVTTSKTSYHLPRLLWTAPIRAESCTPRYCDYRLPAHITLERLKINLALNNSLARLDIFGVRDNTVTPQLRRHINPLSWLHQHRVQARAQVQAKESSDLLAQTLAYQIDHDGRLLKTPEITLDGGIYRSLRLQLSTAQSNMALALGPTAPEIQVAMSEQSLLLLARGDAPFNLLLGGKQAAQHYTEADILGPLRQVTGKSEKFGLAELDASGLSLFPPQAKKALNNAEATPAKPASERKLWLWGVLALAVLVVGAMVLSLLKKPAQSEAPPN